MWPFHLNKRKSSFPKDAFSQVWLKTAQWFYERRFLNFRHFVIFFPWKMRGLHLNSLHPKMLCAKFGWNWPSGSGEEDFQILSMHFRYFVFISTWKRPESFIWIPIIQGCFAPSLVEIGPVVLENKMKMWKVYDNNDDDNDNNDYGGQR